MKKTLASLLAMLKVLLRAANRRSVFSKYAGIPAGTSLASRRSRRTLSITSLLASAALAFGVVSLGTAALAQQPGDKDPSRLPLGEMQPGGRPPGGQPGQPGGRPAGAQPGQPNQPGQPGIQPRPRPSLPPGMQPGGRPGMPPHPQPLRPQPPAEEDHGGHKAAHHCPGHGPTDSPHAPNWWQGIIGVNNEAAQFTKDDHGHFHRTDSGLTQLLWRYENSKDECDPKNQPPPFLASVLNFGLLAFVIFRFGKKPLGEALAARKKSMMAEIENATRLRDEAEERLAEYEDKIENIDDLLEQMKRDHAAQSETERKHVLAEAEERRARMKRDVEFRLQQEAKAAKQALLQEAVEKAVAAAETLLKEKVAKSDQESMADEYLTGLGAAWQGAQAKAERRAEGAA